MRMILMIEKIGLDRERAKGASKRLQRMSFYLLAFDEE